MSTPNDKTCAFELRDSTGNFLFPGMAGYEEALAKAQATQPQPPQDAVASVSRLVSRNAHLCRRVEDLEVALATEEGNYNKVRQQRDALQARVGGLEGQLAIAEQSKVELLAALRDLHAEVEPLRYSFKQSLHNAMARARAAIARATEGGTGQ